MLPQRLPLCSRPSQDPYRILGKAARSSPQALEQRQLHIPGWLHISALSQLPPSTRWRLSHHSHTCSPCPGPCAQVCCPSRPGKEVPCAPTPPSPLQTAYLGKAEVQGQPWGWMAQNGQLLLLVLLSSPPAGPSGDPYFPVPTAPWTFLYSSSSQKNPSTLHISLGRTWHQAQVRKTLPRDGDTSHLGDTELLRTVSSVLFKWRTTSRIREAALLPAISGHVTHTRGEHSAPFC